MTLNIQTHINVTTGLLISILSENSFFEHINGKIINIKTYVDKNRPNVDLEHIRLSQSSQNRLSFIESIIINILAWLRVLTLVVFLLAHAEKEKKNQNYIF